MGPRNDGRQYGLSPTVASAIGRGEIQPQNEPPSVSGVKQRQRSVSLLRLTSIARWKSRIARSSDRRRETLPSGSLPVKPPRTIRGKHRRASSCLQQIAPSHQHACGKCGFSVAPGSIADIGGSEGAGSQPITAQAGRLSGGPHLLGLLVTFIGENLMLRLVLGVWPGLPSDLTDSGETGSKRPNKTKCG